MNMYPTGEDPTGPAPVETKLPDVSKCFFCGAPIVGQAYHIVDNAVQNGDNVDVESVCACFNCRPIGDVTPDAAVTEINKYDP